MSGQKVPIVRADATEAPQIAELIAVAFHSLAVARWLVPNPDRRAEVLPANFRIFVDHALAHGEVHITTDRSAVAVWFPRDSEPLPEPVAYRHRVAVACGEATERFLLLDELFDKHHPNQPHHHLAFLAVQPTRQRRGLGSALLRHHHARLDARGMPAYLEATSRDSRDLYARHGYHQVMGEPFRLPDQTPIWPMWRPALVPERTGSEEGGK
ncbi:MAG: GNAT family N-acetyltransferase [Natronosporangium sp.]